MSSKRNQIFTYLYALAIIMVIDDHCSTRIGFLSSIFPYNSFYMPLFVFSSGYFFHKKPFWNTVLHKTKKILIPYIIYDVIMVCLAFLIDAAFNLKWHRNISILSIIKMLIDKPTTDLNGAAWFAVMLFWVSIMYAIIRKTVHQDILGDSVLTGLLILCGFASLYISMYYSRQNENKWFVLRLLCRNVFYLQFYHLGYMFNRYFEKHVQKLRKYVVCSVCVLINVSLTVAFGDRINFYSTNGMSSFKSWFLPLITSATGIIFYYEIMDFLSSIIGETSLTSFIARNTFTIMQIHLLFVNIPNLYIYYMTCRGDTRFSDFPIDNFMYSTWIRYSPNSRLIGFFLGLGGSLIVAYYLERIKKKIKLIRPE